MGRPPSPCRLCLRQGPQRRRPAGHLAGFSGVLQVDGYDGFKRLALDRADSSVTLAFCWAHMRRGFYEFHVSTKSPLAAGCWRVSANSMPLKPRSAAIPPTPTTSAAGAKSPYCRCSAHLVAGSRWPCLAVSDLAKAIRYAIRHWAGLTVFLEDGRVEMDTNVVERAIRPNTLTRNYAHLRIMYSSPRQYRKR